ncbi:MAG: hypothetical protein MZV49_18310 [Rhodopseudomonas palustris]|nr:hypothetical protein [Rhodopseudomonas palustris]
MALVVSMRHMGNPRVPIEACLIEAFFIVERLVAEWTDLRQPKPKRSMSRPSTRVAVPVIRGAARSSADWRPGHPLGDTHFRLSSAQICSKMTGK